MVLDKYDTMDTIMIYGIYSALIIRYRQLNLPHCAITKKIMGKTSDKRENIRSTRSSQKTMKSVLRKEKKSLRLE